MQWWASRDDRCAAEQASFLRLSALIVSLSACIPQLPQPNAQDRPKRTVSFQQTERAVALLLACTALQ